MLFYVTECTFIILDKHIYLLTGSEVGMFPYPQYPTFSFDWFVSDAMIGDTNLFLHDSQGLCIAEIEIMIADEASRGKRKGWESVILMLLYGNSAVWSWLLGLALVFIMIYIYFCNRRWNTER